MPDSTLEIDGFDELLAAWEQLPKEALVELKQAMQQAVYLLQEHLAEYPPSTDANRPGRTNPATGKPMGFYERGQGWWYPIMRRATLGTKPKKSAGSMLSTRARKLFGEPGGLGMLGVAGYKLRRESEMLGRSWTTQVTQTENAIAGEVGTRVSYAPWLVDDEKQARRMQAIGWVTVGTTMSAEEEAIYAIFEAAVEDVLNKFVRGTTQT
jgi:hypothetical protein